MLTRLYKDLLNLAILKKLNKFEVLSLASSIFDLHSQYVCDVI